MALLSEYGFNEGSGPTSADSSGNSHTLTASNTTTSWDASGKNGKAARLEHTGPVGANTNLSNFTVMAWARRDGTWTNSAGIIGNSTVGMWLEASSANSYQPDVWLNAGPTQVIASTALAVGTWTHVACTYDNANLRIFVNGVQQGTPGAIVGAVVNFGAAGWGVAGSAATIGESADWNGAVDELRVFDTALNAATITTWMNTAIGASGPSPVVVPTFIRSTQAGQLWR